VGEAELADRIAYGIPDILGRDRHLYAGRKTLVVGSGHSVANALLELAKLTKHAAGASLSWATRSVDLARIYSGGDADQLPARGELGANVRELVGRGRVKLTTGFAILALREERDAIVVQGETAEGLRSIGPVNRIIAATGQRPDLALARELRLDLDPWLESARALGPLIDPNVHSCGSVPPHGHRELAHPEPGFYTVGIKSYGRAPTFCCSLATSKSDPSLLRSPAIWRRPTTCGSSFRKPGSVLPDPLSRRMKPPVAAAGPRRQKSMPAA
jgi:hypothetical protein